MERVQSELELRKFMNEVMEKQGIASERRKMNRKSR